MPQWLCRWLLCLAIATPPAAALAVSDEESLPPTAADPDYAAGLAAWKREDWQALIAAMTRVIERRPWHDNAHNLLGFAYRQQGDYDRALAHYEQALELNPYQRGALEYLGETYLAMGRLEQARATLDRLAAVCARLDDAAAGAEPSCEEWRELKAAIKAQLP